ncbi:beta-glucosidase [Companilactobacillus sp. HBUAS56275]|uniref:Glycoside hydrolase family 3 C-terminal domain-containing protein n=1 Tax=Candidatus Companilactobacillus pullicola TaxID=2838523 RepID=A0A9D1ZN80_9LACO|nr:glycoside hydrolase family 3 C-terminal domain-containing protein [Candidatus Companilactobacillus pullicola]
MLKTPSIEQQADEIIESLDMSQKAQLLSQVIWETTSIDHFDKRLNKFLLADGPAGIRRLKEYFDDDIYNTKPSTSYPSPSTYASSWNKDLINELGIHIGKEALQEDVDTMLAPAINLKRSPLGGRNFEYYSEDPQLTSELATSFIKGIQSQGIGACLKHFALNNQETRRMNIDVRVDKQTLHELYLRAFEKPVRVGKPKMVMTSYNQINGEYCASNPLLLDILRRKWGFEGVIVTDCFAAHDLGKGIAHGLTLQMPGEPKEKIVKQIKKLISSNQLTEEQLNNAVKRNIIFDLDAQQNHSRRSKYDRDSHHNFARQVAEESMVLLQNNNNVLPLNEKQNILVVGELAQKPRFQGGGSSHVNPYKLEIPLQELKKLNSNITYSQGYKLNEKTDESLINQVKEQAASTDIIVVFAGLPDLVESEGYDRNNLSLPDNQNDLIKSLSSMGKPLVVVLANGSVVEMPWRNKVDGILESYLGGEAGGSAVADILFGKINPSGHLAESFPEKLQDNPTYLNFPGNQHDVIYGEGRFIGYKYYCAVNKKVAFPFGYGLSYTKFNFHHLVTKINKEIQTATIELTNTGSRAGKEVVQVYTKFLDTVGSPEPLQLAGFKKIELLPNQTKKVEIKLDPKVFEIFDVTTDQWIQQNGKYQLFVGESCLDDSLSTTIDIKASRTRITANHNLGDILRQNPDIYSELEHVFQKHPKSLGFLQMIKDDDPLKSLSMSSLMTLNTLRRADPTLDEDSIASILTILNRGDNKHAKD